MESTVFTAKEGYNFFEFPFGKEFIIQPGLIFGWTSKSRIAKPVDDTKLRATDKQFYMNALISKETVTSTFFKFNSTGHVRMMNDTNVSFDIVSPILGANLVTKPCPLGEQCTVQLDITSLPGIAIVNLFLKLINIK